MVETDGINLGTGAGISVNTIYDRLSRLTGYGRPRFHGPPKRGEIRRSCLNASRALRELRWKPSIELEEGLRLTVEHFRGILRT